MLTQNFGVIQIYLELPLNLTGFFRFGRGQLKCDDAREENRFRLSAKRDESI